MAPGGMIIRSPLDFRHTLGTHACQISEIGIAPHAEPLVAGIEKDLLADIELIDYSDGFDSVADFCESKRDALDQLSSIGYALLAIFYSQKWSTPFGTVSPVHIVHYLITPQHGYFKVGHESDNRQVHRFDTECDQAFTDLKYAITKGEPVHAWMLAQVVREHFDNDPPFCLVCCTKEVLEPDTGREWSDCFEWMKKLPIPPLIDKPEEISAYTWRLSELLIRIDSLYPNVAVFLKSALECASRGLHEPAIVEAWKGIIELLHQLLETFPFDRLKNCSAAWASINSFDELRTKGKDEQLIDASRLLEIIDIQEAMALKALKTKRNACAHPGKHSPGQLAAFGFIDEISLRITAIIDRRPE